MSENLDRALTRVVNLVMLCCVFVLIVDFVKAFGDVETWNRVLTPEQMAWFDDCRALLNNQEACARMVLPPAPMGKVGDQ